MASGVRDQCNLNVKLCYVFGFFRLWRPPVVIKGEIVAESSGHQHRVFLYKL